MIVGIDIAKDKHVARAQDDRGIEFGKRLFFENRIHGFELNDKKRISKLSKGMKSALQFIIGISSHAEITILDEPSNGLNASMRKKMYQSLRESHDKNPRLILLSTHHIEEIQPLCEFLIVIHDKKVSLHETMDDIREYGVWFAGEKNKIEKIADG